MDLHAYIRAVRRRWIVVVACVVIGVLFGFLKTEASTSVYEGSVTFYVATPQLSNDTAFSSDQFAQDRANSYALLLSSGRLARMIKSAGHLQVDAGTIASEISGSAELNTVLVTAQIKDTSVPRLTRITQGVAQQMPKLVNALEQSSGGSTQVALRVVSGPSVNPAAISPRPTLNLALGLGIGLVIGLLLAALREVLDNTVRTADELTETTELPVIGTIVFDPEWAKAPVLVGTSVGGRRAEDYRQLRTNLEFIGSVQRAQAVAITSSVESEGKSSTALNVAILAAETGAKVLLIDADMRRPQIADFVKVEPAVGLSTVLAGRIPFADAVRRWGGFDVLPSGVVPPNPAELLGSDSMRALLDTAREKYDLIIVDTPPVLAVTDAAVVSAVVDAMVLVCRYGRTRRTEISAAVKALRGVGARVVGAVLTMRPRRGVDVAGYGSYGTYDGPREQGWRRGLGRLREGAGGMRDAGASAWSAARARRSAAGDEGWTPSADRASGDQRSGAARSNGKPTAKHPASARPRQRPVRPRD